MIILSCHVCGCGFYCNNRKRKYCSVECVAILNRTRLTVRNGYETTRQRQDGKRDIYIKIRDGGFKRKAVVLLEQKLGRTLKNFECARIIFVDGNRLNCQESNIVFDQRQILKTCIYCGKQRVMTLSRSKDNKGSCGSCVHKAVRKSNSRLSTEDVSCVITLLRLTSSCQISRWFRVTSGTILSVKRGITWKGIKAMASKNVWKTLVEKHEQLKKDNHSSLFDRATILVKIHDDKHFVADMKNEGKSPVQFLDEQVSDTCANFTELLHMLKAFPKRSQWVNGDPKNMRFQVVESLRKKQSEGRESRTPASRKTATLAELRAKEERIKELEQELKLTKQELVHANDKIAMLENKVETLAKLNSAFKAAKRQERSKGQGQHRQTA